MKNLKPLGTFICLDFINLFKGMYKIWEITKVQVKHMKDQSKNRQEHANKGLEEKQAIEEHKWWALGTSARITPTSHCHVKKIIRKLCSTVSFQSKWVSVTVKPSHDTPSTGMMIQQQFCLPQHPLLLSLIMAPVAFSLIVFPNRPWLVRVCPRLRLLDICRNDTWNFQTLSLKEKRMGSASHCGCQPRRIMRTNALC